MTRTRLAVVLWLLFAFVVWNAMFDRLVDGAVWEFLRLESEHFRGRGAPVTIADIIEPRVARGAKLATLVAGAVAIVGLSAVAAAVSRHRGTEPQRNQH